MLIILIILIIIIIIIFIIFIIIIIYAIILLIVCMRGRRKEGMVGAADRVSRDFCESLGPCMRAFFLVCSFLSSFYSFVGFVRIGRSLGKRKKA
jgi:uncharacterized RDD family membrane protein YckC